MTGERGEMAEKVRRAGWRLRGETREEWVTRCVDVLEDPVSGSATARCAMRGPLCQKGYPVYVVEREVSM